MQVLYINLLEIKYLRKHTVVFRENRHRTSIFHCKSCAKTGIQSCAKSDSGAKFSLKITGRFSFMFQQPFRREPEIENFSNHKHTEASAKAIEILEEILQILQMLMHKGNDVPIQKSIRKPKQTEFTPTPTAKPALEDYMKIKPGDSPAIVRLKKLGTIDSTELENFQEELKKEKMH